MTANMSGWVQDPSGLWIPKPGWTLEPGGDWIPPTIRPLQGLDTRKRGSSTPLQLGESKTMVESRSHGEDAELLTVQLGLDLLPIDNTSLGTHAIDVVAVVDWGVGGAQYKAEIDFVHGLTFAVMSNYIRVTARYDGSVPAPPFVPNQFQANASVGYGAIARPVGLARRTLDLGNILHAGTAFFLVPAFATTFGVATEVGAGNTPDLRITFINSGTGSDTTYRYTAATNLGFQNENTYAIPNANAIIGVVTNDAAASAKVQLIFGLSL